MRSPLIAALLAGSALVTPAIAQDAAPVAALVKAVDIPHSSFTLANGLRVVVHTDRKAPIVAVSVWYHIGSKHEPAGKTGFAHLFEHLMFNGSENAPGDFFEPLQQVGATDFNGTTFFDRTNYFETVPTGALDRALFLESDRMGHLLGAITQTTLDNQRGVVQNEKRQGDNQPYGLSFYEILKGLFPQGHPYRHSTIGSMADLDSASLDDVKNWFRQNYGPNNAVIVLAGDVDAETARAKVERWFGDIPAGPAVASPAAPVPTLAAPVTTLIKDRVATTRILRLWAIPGINDREGVALEAGAAVLGGLSSSRLDNALVRDQKIAISVSASAERFEDVGIFFVSMDVKPGISTAEAGAKLDAVIADFLKTGPSRDELNRVATRELSAKIGGLESVGGFGGKAVTLAEGALYSGDPATYRAQLAALAALTPDQVAASSRKWLSRPVFSLITEPGERAAYDEAGASAPKVAPAASVSPAVPPKPVAADRAQLPAVEPLKSLDFPEIERARLRNGIEVYFARRSAVPKLQLSISFDAGFAADPHDALGTQSLMLNVMPEGTKSRSSVQIAEASERLGANIATGAGLDRTSFTLSALTANLAPSLDLLADIVRNPAFAPAEVDRVRTQQLARISAELTQPQGIAGRVMPALIWGKDHPYGIPASGTGDPQIVKTLTPTQLAAFHRRWLRPDTARIFAVGDTSLAALLPMLEKSFGNWASDRSARPVKDFSTPIPPPAPKIYLINRPASPQSVIVAAQVLGVSGRDDLVALRAANEIVGGSFLSRINMDLRESKGWSYGVRSSIGSAENRVAFTLSAPVQADRTGDSIAALRSQLGDFFSTRGVTPAELERTVNSNVRELPGSFETASDVLGGVSSIVNLGRADDYYEALAAKYSGLTATALDATARAQIDPSQLVYVVVGDAAKVRPQLDGLGLTVEELPAPAAP